MHDSRGPRGVKKPLRRVASPWAGAPRRVSDTISLSAKAAAMRMSTPRSLEPSAATALEPRRTLTPRTLGRTGGGRSLPTTACDDTDR